jgi:hypothetical protein
MTITVKILASRGKKLYSWLEKKSKQFYVNTKFPMEKWHVPFYLQVKAQSDQQISPTNQSISHSRLMFCPRSRISSCQMTFLHA